METLKCMGKSRDGAHCGLTDWYPEIEKGIQKALNGKKDWTTGWYSSKKEIASAKITRIGREIEIEVSVSDDLDTNGLGREKIPFTKDIEKIKKAIYAAWDLSEKDQEDNRCYIGFSILREKKVHAVYEGGEPKGKTFIQESWVETYLKNIEGLDDPPGDNYHTWEWQGECKIPKDVKKALGNWAENYELDQEEREFSYKGWKIKPWE